MDYLNRYYKQMNLRRELLLDALERIECDPNIQETNSQKELKRRLSDYEEEVENQA